MNLTSDSSTAIQGLLWQARGPYLVLKQAKALRVNAPPDQMDGDVVIERSNVAFVQVLR